MTSCESTSQKLQRKGGEKFTRDYPHELESRDLIWCANGVTIR